MTSSEPQRGEIWWVQFSPTIGDEMQKNRPAIVISADDLTRLKLRLVIPITGWKPTFASVPWLIQLEPSTHNGLTKVSTANPLQTRSIALERFNVQLGMLEA
ncbi:type II toxin-antitoxin system PemK/MazF family toxin [Stenomitos frigidus]|uniref:PemK family transcriptional regulator n=1 Tax=Stenomitos frigidus ULC18 TaxID=2107698 RepID=A0A2T1DXX7_9CYAN|nr:type II toxin-antitoxin system PemK/MazF family toxin [Stenomitos frigidus]PSB25234.1 PemK family transcriptional regulator [Stenomitos frigidus ULC18]